MWNLIRAFFPHNEVIANFVESFIQHEHIDQCSGVAFFYPGAFDEYRTVGGKVHRFHMRDAYFTGKMKDAGNPKIFSVQVQNSRWVNALNVLQVKT